MLDVRGIVVKAYGGDRIRAIDKVSLYLAKSSGSGIGYKGFLRFWELIYEWTD